MNTWAHACCTTVSIAWKRRQACQVCQFRVDRCFSFWWTFRGYLCSLDPTVGIGKPDLVRSCLLLAVRLAGCGLICIDLLRMMFPSAYPSKWQDIKKKKKIQPFHGMNDLCARSLLWDQDNKNTNTKHTIDLFKAAFLHSCKLLKEMFHYSATNEVYS